MTTYELYVKDADGHAESYLWTDPCSRNAGWERYRKIRGTMYIFLSVVTPWSTGVNVSSPINLGSVCLSAFILSAINVAHRGQRFMTSLVDLTTSSASNRSSLSTCLECRFGCLPVCWHTFSWDNHDLIYFRTNQKSWLGIALLVLWETMVDDFEDPTYLSNVIFLKNSKGFKVPENLLFLSSYRSHGSKTACEDLFALQTSDR